MASCKSIESAIQWFQAHHRITFTTIQNSAVYLSGARVSIFPTLVPRLCGLTFIPCSTQIGIPYQLLIKESPGKITYFITQMLYSSY